METKQVYVLKEVDGSETINTIGLFETLEQAENAKQTDFENRGFDIENEEESYFLESDYKIESMDLVTTTTETIIQENTNFQMAALHSDKHNNKRAILTQIKERVIFGESIHGGNLSVQAVATLQVPIKEDDKTFFIKQEICSSGISGIDNGYIEYREDEYFHGIFEDQEKELLQILKTLNVVTDLY